MTALQFAPIAPTSVCDCCYANYHPCLCPPLFMTSARANNEMFKTAPGRAKSQQLRDYRGVPVKRNIEGEPFDPKELHRRLRRLAKDIEDKAESERQRRATAKARAKEGEKNTPYHHVPKHAADAFQRTAVARVPVQHARTSSDSAASLMAFNLKMRAENHDKLAAFEPHHSRRRSHELSGTYPSDQPRALNPAPRAQAVPRQHLTLPLLAERPHSTGDISLLNNLDALLADREPVARNPYDPNDRADWTERDECPGAPTLLERMSPRLRMRSKRETHVDGEDCLKPASRPVIKRRSNGDIIEIIYDQTADHAHSATVANSKARPQPQEPRQKRREGERTQRDALPSKSHKDEPRDSGSLATIKEGRAKSRSSAKLPTPVNIPNEQSRSPARSQSLPQIPPQPRKGSWQDRQAKSLASTTGPTGSSSARPTDLVVEPLRENEKKRQKEKDREAGENKSDTICVSPPSSLPPLSPPPPLSPSGLKGFLSHSPPSLGGIRNSLSKRKSFFLFSKK
ncbi:MAG: hypothetical protein M1829_001435 [Trizodia sp. TS-e1964]|nr:MAG: hypothetical protein M1829_001435 [Trizodia sp. TS-e1964]